MASAAGKSLLFGHARAQTAGTPPAAAVPAGSAIGSPAGTRTIPGDVLPPLDLPWGGTANLNAAQSTPWWQPRVVPPQGAPNILLIMTDDVGFGAPGTFGGGTLRKLSLRVDPPVLTEADKMKLMHRALPRLPGGAVADRARKRYAYSASAGCARSTCPAAARPRSKVAEGNSSKIDL